MESNEEDISGKSLLYIVIIVISICFIGYEIYTEVDDYFEKEAVRLQYKKDNIKNHQRWINEMTYNLNNLSKHHYIKTVYLDENRTYQKFLKVIEINDLKVKLVKFRVGAFNPIPRLIQESYIKDNNKDTIIITIDKLKKTIFNTSRIIENSHIHKDSLRREGVFYLIDDIYYINGPSLSRHSEIASTKSGQGDTIFFNFENLNKKALLTKIINVTGDFKWHNALPISINGYKLNSNRKVEFDLKATNVDFSKDFKFKLYFEDPIKNEHIFLVTKRFKGTSFFYESKRIFD